MKIDAIIPQRILFHSASEGRIRKQFIEEVIGLPSNLFYGTNMPASVIIFNKASKTITPSL